MNEFLVLKHLNNWSWNLTRRDLSDNYLYKPCIFEKLRAGLLPVKTIAEEVNQDETIYKELIEKSRPVLT